MPPKAGTEKQFKAGQGTEYKLPSGSWGIAGRYLGQRYHVTGRTLTEARHRRSEIQQAIREGRVQEKRRAGTFGALLDDWLKTKAPPATRRATYARYELAARQLRTTGGLQDVPAAEVDAQRQWEALRALTDSGLSPVSVRHAHLALKQAVGLAIERGRAVPVVPKSLKPPKIERAPLVIPAAADVHRLVEGAPSEWRVLWELLAVTGLRLGEALALRWQDVTAQAVTVRRSLEDGEGYVSAIKEFPKSEAGIRAVPIPTHMARLLDDQRRRQETLREAAGARWQRDWGELVFSNREGGPLRKNNVHRAFKRDAEAALGSGDGWHPHLLRHAYASHLLLQGKPVQVVQRLLGHASPDITLRVYAHLVQGAPASDAGDVIAAVYDFGTPSGGDGHLSERGTTGRKRPAPRQMTSAVTSGPRTRATDTAATR